jgi:hypothetical protein
LGKNSRLLLNKFSRHQQGPQPKSKTRRMRLLVQFSTVEFAWFDALVIASGGNLNFKMGLPLDFGIIYINDDAVSTSTIYESTHSFFL